MLQLWKIGRNLNHNGPIGSSRDSISAARSTIPFYSENVALCKQMENLYVSILVGDKVCNAMLDCGSTVSLIDKNLLARQSEVILKSVKTMLINGIRKSDGTYW